MGLLNTLQDKAASENEKAKRLEAEERARKAELRVRELEAQVQELARENEWLRGVDNDAELQKDLNEVWGKEMTAKLNNVWNRCDEDRGLINIVTIFFLSTYQVML